jgi:uncharacterized UPF0146 family protein
MLFKSLHTRLTSMKRHLRSPRKINPPVLKISWEALQRMSETIGTRPAETGGAFGGLESDRVATSYLFDETSRNSAVTYTPDHVSLKQVFKTEWKPEGIRLLGFVHSHPGSMGIPSGGDEAYARRILEAIPDMPVLWLPIINTVPDTGGFAFTPWAVVRDGDGIRVIRGTLEISDLPKDETLVLAGLKVPRRALAKKKLSEIRVRRPVPCIHNTFERVREAYDLPLMATSRVIAIGAGGAAEWLEQLARAGVGQFVLVDPDVVSETNLATQQVYRRDIGRPKVDCIAERIRDINPQAVVHTLRNLLDDINDPEMERLAHAPLDGRSASRTLLCGLTDNFPAQARVNRLALTLGIPSLSGQVYKEGRGCEITFTYPGVTPACHRCILSSRYRYYLEEERENPVTSHGTPIFATSRLNATKGFIALALLHHGSQHQRWGGMLKKIGNRNLAVVRMDPDFSSTIGMRAFDKAFAGADGERLFFDETLWLPQLPESPDTGHAHCPDCGGTGDLRDAIASLPKTALCRSPQTDPNTAGLNSSRSSKSILNTNNPEQTMKTQTPQSSPASKATINQMFGRPYHLYFEDEFIEQVRSEGNETAAKLMELSNARNDVEMSQLSCNGGPFSTIYTCLPSQLNDAEKNGQPLAATAIRSILRELGDDR